MRNDEVAKALLNAASMLNSEAKYQPHEGLQPMADELVHLSVEVLNGPIEPVEPRLAAIADRMMEAGQPHAVAFLSPFLPDGSSWAERMPPE